MIDAGIVTITIGVLGVFGGGGFWVYRQSRRDAPVRQRDADLAVAEKSQQMAMVIAVAAQENSERAQQDSDRLRLDMEKERTERHLLTTRVVSLEHQVKEQGRTISHLRRTVQAFSEAWDDLVAHWDHHRTQKHPPERPFVPQETYVE